MEVMFNLLFINICYEEVLTGLDKDKALAVIKDFYDLVMGLPVKDEDALGSTSIKVSQSFQHALDVQLLHGKP